jgi:predicted permease
VSLKSGDDAPERAFAELASDNFFDVLGVHAALGRTFLAGEEASMAPVAVLSRSYWERRFNRDSSIVGKSVLLNGQGFTVIGVAPSGFGGSEIGLGFDLWVPVTTIELLSPGSRSLEGTGNQWLSGLARLSPGTSLEQARPELERVSTRVAIEAGIDPPTPIGIRRLSDGPAGRFLSPLFYTLFALGGVILLVACANVANLLIARGVSRSRELAVQLAIGAGRGRIVRQLLTESLLLALAGGVVGLGFAYLGRNLLAAIIPPLPLPIVLEPRVSSRVIELSFGLSCATALVFGLLPALRASRPELVAVLKDEQLPGSARSLLRSALVVTQVAFALVALIAAGLFVRSAAEARRADPGFSNLDHLLVADTDFHLAGIPDSLGPVVRDRLLDLIGRVPGVARVSLTTDLPVSIGNTSANGVTVEGYVPRRDENTSVENASVAAGYFDVLGIPVLKGRPILASDRADQVPVIVVNESFTRRFWPGVADPVGRRVNVAGTWRTVIGVVGNVKMESMGESPYAYFYLPHAQRYQSSFALVVATAGPPASVAAPIRDVFASVNPNLPMLDARSMRENMAGAMFVQSMGATLLSGLGVAALALAGLGLFAVQTYLVTLRRREIGIRMALGARPAAVVRLVVRQGASLVALGLVIGAGLAVVVARLIRSQLFGVSPADPATYATIGALVAVVAVVASFAPARRATRMDPVRALRLE